MKPPGKITLSRMQQAAYLEAERIEISQDFWVRQGVRTEPVSEMVERRDAFAGIVRVFDAIMSDSALLDRLQQRMAAPSRATPLQAPDESIGDTPIDAGVET